jgi:cytochrome b561
MTRIEEEERQLKENLLLSEEAGVIQSADDIVVKKKNVSDYIKEISHIVFSAVFLVLVFLGLLVLLNPTSREILLSILKF